MAHDTRKLGVDVPKYVVKEYEYQTKANALRKIDDDKISLTLQRLDFLQKQRLAFTKWDVANGACGHKFSKKGEEIDKYLEIYNKNTERLLS